jgi:hypothetical protein
MTKPVRIVGLGGSLRAEVVRAARQFQDHGTCDYAEDQPYAADRP